MQGWQNFCWVNKHCPTAYFKLVIGGLGGGEGTHEKDELPALFFGQAFLKGGHGFSAYTDFVKQFAVGSGAHALGVGEARRGWVIHRGIRAIAFPGFAVALDAFIKIDGAGSGEPSWRSLDGILAALGFFGDFPLAVLIKGNRDGDNNRGEESSE